MPLKKPSESKPYKSQPPNISLAQGPNDPLSP